MVGINDDNIIATFFGYLSTRKQLEKENLCRKIIGYFRLYRLIKHFEISNLKSAEEEAMRRNNDYIAGEIRNRRIFLETRHHIVTFFLISIPAIAAIIYIFNSCSNGR